MSKRNKRKKGIILVVTLWVLAILSLLAAGISFRMSLEIKTAKYALDRLKAFYLAKAGIVRAVTELENDDNDYDSRYECGMKLEEEKSGEEIFKDLKLGGGSFSVGFYDESEKIRYGMADEERRININSASHNILSALLVTVGELDQEEASDIAYAIIDWRDIDDFKSSPGSAEERYYRGLDFPYSCKNDVLQSPEELLLVRGMDAELFAKLEGFITVYGEGRININTASRQTLTALGLNENLSEKLLALRDGDDEVEGTEDDHIFKNTGVIISDLQEFTELSPQESVQITNLINKDLLTVKSNYFRIRAIGRSEDGKVVSEITAVVERLESEPARIRYWYEE